MLANTPAPQKVPKNQPSLFLTKTRGKTCRERMEPATDRHWQAKPKARYELKTWSAGARCRRPPPWVKLNARPLTPGCDPGVWLPVLPRSLRSSSSPGSRFELRRPPNCFWSVRRSLRLVPESFRLPFGPSARPMVLPSGGLGGSRALEIAIHEIGPAVSFQNR